MNQETPESVAEKYLQLRAEIADINAQLKGLIAKGPGLQFQESQMRKAIFATFPRISFENKHWIDQLLCLEQSNGFAEVKDSGEIYYSGIIRFRFHAFEQTAEDIANYEREANLFKACLIKHGMKEKDIYGPAGYATERFVFSYYDTPQNIAITAKAIVDYIVERAKPGFLPKDHRPRTARDLVAVGKGNTTELGLGKICS